MAGTEPPKPDQPVSDMGSDQPVPDNGPDRIRDRRALTAVASQFFANGAVLGSVLPRLPEIRDQVGITASAIGFMISAAAIGGLVASALVGRVITHFGTRRVMLFGGSVVALSLVVIGLAREPVALAVGLAMLLSFDVPVDVAMNLQGSWLSARRRVPVMSRLHGLWSLGTVLGGIASSRLAGAGVSLTTHLLVASLILILILLWIGRGLLVADETHADTASGSPATGVGETPKRRTVSANPRIGLLLMAVAGFAASTVEATSIDWSAFRFTDDLGASPSRAALAYVAAFSEPDNYQAFVNAVGFLPTQPTATLETQLGEQVAQYLPNYRVGFEQFWVEPSGAGQWANGSLAASWYQPFNEWDDAVALADASQGDLQAGLDANG